MAGDYSIIVNKLVDLYVNNWTKFLMCSPYKESPWIPLRKDGDGYRYLTKKDIYLHLRGYYNVGVYAAPKAAKFITFDVDVMDTEIVRKIMDTLERIGFDRDKIYVSISGGKGYHVEMFFDRPVANNALDKLYEIVIQEGGFDSNKVEFRPTPSRAIRLPLSTHYKTGNMGWFLDRNTFKPTEMYDYIFYIQKVSRDKLDKIVNSIKLKPKPKPPEPPALADHIGIDFDRMPQIEEPKTRHDLMVDIATELRYGGHSRDEIYDALLKWADEQDQALIQSSPLTVQKDAKDISEWVFSEKFTIYKKHLDEIDRVFVYTPEDINWILNGKNKTQRRILFMLCTSGKIYSKVTSSYKLMAEDIGCVIESARSNVQKMREAGLIKAYNGRTIVRGGEFKKDPNMYLKGDCVEQVVNPEHVAAYTYCGKVIWRDIVAMYAEVMSGALGRKLSRYVGEAEARDIRRILKEREEKEAV